MVSSPAPDAVFLADAAARRRRSALRGLAAAAAGRRRSRHGDHRAGRRRRCDRPVYYDQSGPRPSGTGWWSTSPPPPSRSGTLRLRAEAVLGVRVVGGGHRLSAGRRRRREPGLPLRSGVRRAGLPGARRRGQRGAGTAAGDRRRDRRRRRRVHRRRRLLGGELTELGDLPGGGHHLNLILAGALRRRSSRRPNSSNATDGAGYLPHLQPGIERDRAQHRPADAAAAGRGRCTWSAAH